MERILERQYDAYSNKTHLHVRRDGGTGWYYVSGELTAEEALAILRDWWATRE